MTIPKSSSSADLTTGLDARPRPRFAAVDMARGAALVGVVFYHFAWDLSFLRFVSTDVMFHPAWIGFARLLASSFLFLVGVSLVLAHGNGMRWPAFWRRFAILAAAALAITLVTYVSFPQSYVFFGILHAIALFSLLALPFLRAPLWLVGLVALVVLAVPQFVHLQAFNAPGLAWLGLWSAAPPANDLVPVFPSFGMVLLGVIVARLVLAGPLRQRLASWQAESLPFRILRILGQWTLVIYLVHQPLLFGGLYLLAQIVQPEKAARAADFTSSCEANCIGTQGEGNNCRAYCSCALAIISEHDLWEPLQGGQSTPAQQEAMASIFPQCSAPDRP